MKTALIACAAALLAVACGNNATKSSTSTATSTPSGGSAMQKCQDRALPTPAPASDTKTKPTIVVPDGAPPCKLVIQDIKIGTGAAAKPSSTVTAQYVGVAWSTRQEFDSSWAHGGQPISFP